MPSKKQYNLVQNDDYDTRIPLHPEEAFQHGITFQAKFIGTLDVPRPTSRVEIVAAMRRIRYEFKSKGVKKRKVNIEVSVDGVKVSLRKKKKKNQWMDDKLLLFQHPVYRIFYVSHDSQDLKIFSYIARDGASNVFKCNVFKSNKKSQAMRIVRTVGQAFEVCHKLSINAPPEEDQEAEDQLIPLDTASDRDSLASDKGNNRDLPITLLGDPVSCDTLAADSGVLTQLMDSPTDSAPTLSPSVAASPQTPPSQPPALQPPIQPQVQQQQPQQQSSPRQLRLDLAPPPSNNNTRRSPMSADDSTNMVAQHEMQMMHEQMEQQAQQTQAAVAQVHLLRDQLAAETAARLEAQARTHQLLVHNKELLEHIQMLVLHLQEMERAQQGGVPSMHQPQNITPTSPRVTMVPQMAVLCDPQTPALAPVYLPDFQETDALRLLPQRANTNQPNTNNPAIFGLNYTNDILQRLQTLYRQPPPPPTTYYTHPNYRTSPYSGSPVLTHRLMSYPAPEPSPTSLSTTEQFFRTSPTPPSNQPIISNNNNTNNTMSPTSAADQINANSPFIRPLSQVGTLTTTDNDGRVRVIVPVPADEPSPPADQVRAGAPQELAAALGLMRVSGGAGPDDYSPTGTLRKRAATASPGTNGPVITRSTSEKVPNRSELMSQVQRTAWARHTTK